MERLYSLVDVARLLQVSPLTVRRWVLEGKIEALHPAGTRLYRIPESSLRAFVGDEWWERIIQQRGDRIQRQRGNPRRQGRQHRQRGNSQWQGKQYRRQQG